jgi:hypothetical protein
MLRNMTNSLFTHEAIRTTLPKAKELRRVAEPLITLAKVATVANRRVAFDRLRDRDVVTKLFNELGPRYQARRRDPHPEIRLPWGQRLMASGAGRSPVPAGEAAGPRPNSAGLRGEAGRAPGFCATRSARTRASRRIGAGEPWRRLKVRRVGGRRLRDMRPRQGAPSAPKPRPPVTESAAMPRYLAATEAPWSRHGSGRFGTLPAAPDESIPCYGGVADGQFAFPFFAAGDPREGGRRPMGAEARAIAERRLPGAWGQIVMSADREQAGGAGQPCLRSSLPMRCSVTNTIHATTHLDEIILDLGRDICSLFGADRLTIYVVCDGGKSIVTKIKTGLNSYKDFKLPVTDQSVAGYVALHKRIVNIRDVYDAKELASYSPHPNFLRLVDAKTGYRTRQMLVAPVVEAQTGALVGVVQLINTVSGEPFPAAMEEGVTLLCETLAIALRQRQRPAGPIKGKYDALIANAVISAEELELATRSARRKNLDVETVLIDEFRVKPSAIGEALAPISASPRAVQADRVKSSDLLRNLSRKFLKAAWVPIDDTMRAWWC